MAGSTIIGLGAGTIILLILWITTACLWILLHRSQNDLRYIVTIISTITTLTLFLLPPETNEDHHPTRYTQEEEVVYDYMFIWRAILIIILTLSLLVGMALSVSEFWTLKVHGSDAVPRRHAKSLDDHNGGGGGSHDIHLPLSKENEGDDRRDHEDHEEI